MYKKVIFISPEFEKTFWSWKYLLKFVGKLAAFIPLALLTIAALFPSHWEKELIDLNVLCNKRLLASWNFFLKILGFKRTSADLISKRKLQRADIIVISGIIGQKKSIEEIIARCLEFGKEIWLGGSLLETEEMCDEYPGVTRFCIGKGERVVLQMLADYENGIAKRIYNAKDFGFPSINESPIPLYELANSEYYSSAAFQDSWGCPFICTYCLERHIDGLKWQQKSFETIRKTLDALYVAGFRDAVQVFSSNFAGNIKKAKELAGAIADWQREHSYPFEFTIEVSVLIARYPDLMASMVEAGIKKVFLGLETDDEDCLLEAKKFQNLENKLKMSLREAVRKIHQAGLLSLTGIIACGFDTDKPDFADRIIKLIQDTCPIPMVDTLQAQPGATLWDRLISLNRKPWRCRSNTAFLPNFPTILDSKILAKGFVEILETVWQPREYYERIRKWWKEYGVEKRPPKKISFASFKAFMRANLWIGLLGGPKVSYYYWRSLIETFFSKKRAAFADVVTLWVYHTHFRRATREEIKLAKQWLAQAV